VLVRGVLLLLCRNLSVCVNRPTDSRCREGEQVDMGTMWDCGCVAHLRQWNKIRPYQAGWMVFGAIKCGEPYVMTRAGACLR